MKLRTEFTYKSGDTDITVYLDTSSYALSDSVPLEPEQILKHIEAIYKITNCPKAPTDKEMDEMEEYFSESDDE